MKKTKRYIYVLTLILLFLSFNINFNTSNAASMKIKYNNTVKYYKGNKINCVLDGKNIKMNSTKGIVINGSVMVPYKEVVKTGMKISCKLDSAKQKLTISGNGKKIIMKTGSKTASVNGKKKSLKQAPVKVKYYSKNTSKLLIPLKFVATTLGYSYEYNKNTGTVNLTSPFVIKYNSEWHIYKKYKGSASYNNTIIKTDSMPLLSINGCVMAPAKAIIQDSMGLSYTYDKTSGTVTLTSPEHTIVMSTNNNIATIDNNTTIQLKSPPMVVKRKDTSYSCMMIPLASTINAFDYYYSWDSIKYQAAINKKNYINWYTTENYYDNEQYINGLSALNAVYDLNTNNMIFTLALTKDIAAESFIFEDDSTNNELRIRIPQTANMLGPQTYNLNMYNITNVNCIQDTDDSLLLSFKYTKALNYYYSISGNIVNLYFTLNNSVGSNSDYSINIPLPDTVSFGSLLSEDMYYNKSFKVEIPGNHETFYNTNFVSVSSEYVSSYWVNYNTSNNTTEIIFLTDSIVGYKLYEDTKSVSIKVGKPADIYNNIVILDAGHGGKDPGAVNNKTNESDLNYTILYNKARKYFNSPNSPVKAYWTRVDDTYITLADRAAFASKMKATMFVSLHMNSSDKLSAKGTEIYYSNYNNKASSLGINSYKLATRLLDSIVPAIGTSSRGVKSANYYVIKNNTVPAVLIELGFLTNSTDYNIITNAGKQELAAKAIYDTIVSIYTE